MDLSSVFSAVGTLLQDRYGWRSFRDNYWLDTVPFGMEFGPQDGSTTGSGASYFSLNLGLLPPAGNDPSEGGLRGRRAELSPQPVGLGAASYLGPAAERVTWPENDPDKVSSNEVTVAP